MSSVEDEYKITTHDTIKFLWLQSLLQELLVKHQTPTIMRDNLSAVSHAHNPMLHSRIKHMKLEILFVKEKVMNMGLTVTHILAQDQWADVPTKPLPTSKFIILITKLKVVDNLTLNQPS